MKRLLLAATAALLLAACADGRSSLTEPSLAEPAPPSFAAGDAWSLFTNQTPNETLTFTGSGWEVGTRFYVTEEVCVHGLRFWRASGETGTNRIRLWRESTGAEVVSRIAESTPSSGWAHAYVSSIVCLLPNVWYRVSVNTNTAQVKTFGAFSNGPIVNGPMHATSGYYGQPTGSMPTTASSSNFFVDLVAVESY